MEAKVCWMFTDIPNGGEMGDIDYFESRQQVAV